MATTTFPQVASVPVLDLAQVMQLNADRTATLIGDLNDLLMTVDCSLTDLVCCTNPSMTTYVKLWGPS